MAHPGKVDTVVGPRGALELLTRQEVDVLTRSAGSGRLYELFRRCALAVLNTGNELDDADAVLEAYSDFHIEVTRRTRGLELVIENAPASAFVGGRMIEGVRQHLFAVLRDIVYTSSDIEDPSRFDLATPDGITDAVFHILKHARVLVPELKPKTVVCWGGHAISRVEYDYSKEVGYQLGLRGLDICTGCGPGAMKGPMKGAAVGHAKQRIADARYIGLSEPGIIAAEPPNPMVNHLVILPDIEKRLEAFVRLAHAIVVFPGGAGTAEEVLYLLGVLLDPGNRRLELPVVFSGPPESESWFAALDRFLKSVLGQDVASLYTIVIDDPARVGDMLMKRVRSVRRQRLRDGDAYYFNWLLKVPFEHQRPFTVSHEAVAGLPLHPALPRHELAVNLRRAFSAIVTGNVKDNGIRMIRRHGPFELSCDPALASALDSLLSSFVAQGRMKIAADDYVPCYRVRAAA
jgi:predicted Rossmann-fold nucleotide-binding protein